MRSAVWRGRRFWVLPAILLTLHAARSQPAWGQRPAASLKTNTEVVKRLATVEDHVKEEQWEQAILILQQVAADQGDSLIAVAPRRYLNVGTYCNSILANLPPAGLAVYRTKSDPQAKQWFETGYATRNRALLEKVVQQAFVSSYGDDALFWLGEWAWDAGDLAAARDYWSQLLPLKNPPDVGQPQPVLRYPDASYETPMILARLVLCSILEGNGETAARGVAYVAEQFPDAKGELAGRTGPLAEILKAVLQEARGWTFPEPAGQLQTFAGNPARNLIYPRAPDVGGVQWELPLPEPAYRPPSPRRGLIEPAPLSYFPVIVGETVLLCDPDRVYAFDLRTGRAKWPREGDGTITERKELDGAAIYEADVPTPHRQQHLVGVPFYTLTVHENRVYARMGSPITGGAAGTTLPIPSRVICLDLATEGKLVWSREPSDLLGQENPQTLQQWAFEGSPIVAGGCTFVALRRSHPQTEARVACLDAETGKVQWTRRVGAAVSNFGEQQNYVSHHLLTVGENLVFYAPEFGVVTALEAGSGRVLWAVTYPSQSPKESPALRDPAKQGLTPCVFHRGVVYAAPTDSESVLAIAAKTGVILWEQRIPFDRDFIRHVLGVTENRLILSGNELWILDALTGKIEAPKQPTPGRQPAFDGYGRGVLVQHQIYWPTRNSIEIRSLQTGLRMDQPVKLPAHGGRGGHLAIAGGTLLVTEPNRLVAYSNLAKVKQTERNRISQNPKAAPPRLRLAQIEEAAEEFDQALTLYQEAAALATPADLVDGQPLASIARQARFQLLVRLGTKAAAANTPHQAIGYLEEAVPLTTDLSSRAAVLGQLGEMQRQGGRVREAVRTFQTLLDDDDLAHQPRAEQPPETYGQFAKAQIADLIRQQGRAVYAEFDEIAAEQIADRLHRRDLAGARRIIEQFPNALISAETKHQLALIKREAGEAVLAVLEWQQLLEEDVPASIRETVLLEQARTLERLGHLRPAFETWQRLEREFPGAQVRVEETATPAKTFVPTHLSSAVFRKELSSKAPLPLVRRWQRELPAESSVFFPEGTPPAAALDCALIEQAGITCVDRASGEDRWQKPLDDHVLWAAFGRSHLVIGTRQSLTAVTLETGTTLWQRRWNPAGSPPRFELVADRIFVLQSRGVFCVEANLGYMEWSIDRSEALAPTWFVDADFVVLQTVQPVRVLVLSASTGKVLSERSFPEPWILPPVRLSLKDSTVQGQRNGFAVVLANRQIRAFAAHNALADPSWIYQGAASHANAEPFLLPAEDHLLLLMDGDTLMNLAPQTGGARWFQPPIDQPILRPQSAIAILGDQLFLLTGNTLRCVGLADGRVTWRQQLPPSASWSLQDTGEFLVCLSENPNPKAILVEPNRGERVQELLLESNVLRGDFRGPMPVVRTKDQLIGFGKWQSSPPNELTQSIDLNQD